MGVMTRRETFQVSSGAAEIYESRFVPALFAQWAPLVVDQATVTEGQRILDVACGTGVVARAAADRVGPHGLVVGLDLNPGMLAVARRIRPDLDWCLGDAGTLPFPDDTFDAALCQMALMFFPDRRRSLAEMHRVARRVTVCVPAALPDQPAYGLLVRVAARHAGPEAVALLDTYWSCGDRDELVALVGEAGATVERCTTHTGTARFPSPDALVDTEIDGSPLAERIGAETREAIRRDVRSELARYVQADGTVAAPLVAHVVTGRRAHSPEARRTS